MAYRRGVIILALQVAVLTGCMTMKDMPIRTITGTVTDNNNRPVEGAIVSTDPPSSSVATDSQGRYTLRALKEGQYTIKALMPGYVCPPITVEIKGVDIQADLKLLPEGMASVPASTSFGPKNTTRAKPASTSKSSSKAKASSSKEATPEKPKKKWWWQK